MMDFFQDDQDSQSKSTTMDVPLSWNSQESDEAFAELLDPSSPLLGPVDDFLVWKPSGSVDRISMAVYRMASMHQTTTTHLSRNQMVDCMEKMDAATTLVDKIDVIKRFFPSVMDVRCCDHDVQVRIGKASKGWVSHKRLFGGAVDVDNIFDYLTGEVHVLGQSHPYAKDNTLTLVMTHLPTPSGVPIRSFLQLDELIFATDARNTKAIRGMPYVHVMEKAIGRGVLQNKVLMSKKVATFAYTVLRQNMSQHAKSTTMYTVFAQANAQVAVSDDTSRHMWEWILQVFDGIYSISRDHAVKAWSIFSIAVCTKSSFFISCAKIGPLHNAHPSRGVTIDTIDKTLFNVRGSLFIRNVLFKDKQIPKRRKWNRYMARSLVVSVFAKYHRGLAFSHRYTGRISGTIDLTYVAPFVMLEKAKVANYIDDHHERVESPTKRARVTKQRSVLIPIKESVVIRNSQIV